MLSPGRMRLFSSVPQLRPLVLRIPLAVGVAQARRCAPWRASVSSSRRAPPNAASKLPASSASSSDLVLSAPQQRLVPTRNGCVPVGDRLGVGVDDQPRADLGGVAIAELDHLAELVGGVDVQQRERDRARIERLLRQPQQHRRVLADRIEHHRPLELGDHLAHDVDALGLERREMVVAAGARRSAGRGDRFTTAAMGICAPKKKPGGVPGLLVCRSVEVWFSGCLDVTADRAARDPQIRTTTRAQASLERHQRIDMYQLRRSSQSAGGQSVWPSVPTYCPSRSLGRRRRAPRRTDTAARRRRTMTASEDQIGRVPAIEAAGRAPASTGRSRRPTRRSSYRCGGTSPAASAG